jgi:arylformamidase
MEHKIRKNHLPVAGQIDHTATISPHSQWIDVSVPVSNAMVHWPGDPPIDIERVQDMDKGDAANLSRILMGSHTGTHVDAPRHFIYNGATVSTMPIETMVGSARVIEILNHELIKPEELAEHRIRRGERILFKTLNSSRVWKTNAFVEDFVSISKSPADFLVDKGVRVVGVDYLSVGGFHGDGHYIHKTLLAGGVWIIEGLDLSRVRSGRYHLICLPLNIDQGDGAPARAVLSPLFHGWKQGLKERRKYA